VAVPWPGSTVVGRSHSGPAPLHVPEPKGVLSVTINGRTYLGNPPALTLFQKDLVSFVTVAIVLGTGLLVATVTW